MSENSQYPDDSDNVLAFTKRFDSNADIREMRNVTEAPKPAFQHCFHNKVETDEHRRVINCRLCGKVIDPFDWVLSIANKETKLDWELTGLRGEIKQHREGLEKLRREETNCRARIKTSQFRLNDVNMALLEAGDRLVKVKGEK
ncbi:hypothetical protein [Pantoea sp.]|uniref:hypothetical protein n=1 Tax=Pantoea sp. TaxID=69393 RepID=UPI0028970401|nr:hypothetical protein [Pantoea sp.]